MMLKLTNRATTYMLLLLALLTWTGIVLFTHYVPPQGMMAFAAFFMLLAVALASTFAPVAYVIGLRFISSRLYRATMRHAVRQGILLSLCIVLNLILRALHSWNIITAIIIFVAALVIELVSLARK
ncbi:MAG TPA: hypothetical protein VKR42_09475 [Ktedonobacteraceae bacterium]|nr:hypothetical protein [Ktedonobacteraceae bacterium]